MATSKGSDLDDRPAPAEHLEAQTDHDEEQDNRASKVR